MGGKEIEHYGRVRIQEDIEKVFSGSASIHGPVTDIIPDAKSGDIILAIYFKKSTNVTDNYRKVGISFYGGGGYNVAFMKGDDTMYSNVTVKYTAVYYSV